MKNDGFLERCGAALKRTRGMVWIGIGASFLTLGSIGQSGAYIGLGAAFLAIGLSARKRSGTG